MEEHRVGQRWTVIIGLMIGTMVVSAQFTGIGGCGGGEESSGGGGSFCGDGTCDSDETSSSCSADCGGGGGGGGTTTNSAVSEAVAIHDGARLFFDALRQLGQTSGFCEQTSGNSSGEIGESCCAVSETVGTCDCPLGGTVVVTGSATPDCGAIGGDPPFSASGTGTFTNCVVDLSFCGEAVTLNGNLSGDFNGNFEGFCGNRLSGSGSVNTSGACGDFTAAVNSEDHTVGYNLDYTFTEGVFGGAGSVCTDGNSISFSSFEDLLSQIDPEDKCL